MQQYSTERNTNDNNKNSDIVPIRAVSTVYARRMRKQISFASMIHYNTIHLVKHTEMLLFDSINLQIQIPEKINKLIESRDSNQRYAHDMCSCIQFACDGKQNTQRR